MSEKKYYLAVGCIFKNESNSIREWMEHYLKHGVEHFYLIDDGSIDDSIEKILDYLHSGIVTLYQVTCPYYLGRQRNMYMQFIHPHVKETQWLIMVDMDEYLWSKESMDLKKLFSQFHHLSQIQFAHTLYGSNGHHLQPDSIVKHFTKRSKNCPCNDPGNVKYAINTDFTFTELNIHHAIPENKLHLHRDYFQIFDEPYFILNHYCCQSLEFWKNVKCTRGDADNYRVRSDEDFYLYDLNDVEDYGLLEQNHGIDNV